jgi:hypothetical protein
MDTPGTDLRNASSWQRPATACLATLVLAVLAVVVVGLATAIEQHANPPTCFGLGFGCTPDAYTSAVLVAVFAGAPAVAIAWTLSVVGWMLTRRRSDRTNRWATWWQSWLLAGILAIVLVLAALTAG